MPKVGPGTKLVVKALEHAFPDIPDEHEEGSRQRQGPGTKLVMKALEHAFPHIADSHERDPQERERTSHVDDSKAFYCYLDYL